MTVLMSLFLHYPAHLLLLRSFFYCWPISKTAQAEKLKLDIDRKNTKFLVFLLSFSNWWLQCVTTIDHKIRITCWGCGKECHYFHMMNADSAEVTCLSVLSFHHVNW